MSKKRIGRLLTAFVLCTLMVCSLSVTAFAGADDTPQELPVTGGAEPEEIPQPDPEETSPDTETEEEPETEAFTMGDAFYDPGNAYTRDLLYDKATNKQFITVQTKNGNTFYIVIDYDAPINEEEEQYQTYFLNMVDEADLLSLLDEDTVAALTACNCTEKCVAGDINTNCPVCKSNMSECTGTEPVVEEPTEPEEPTVDEPEKKSNIGMIIGVIVLVGLGGGAYYYFKFIRGKKTDDEDLDFYDDDGYEEEEYINEDAEPDIAEDDEEQEDEEV